MRRLLFTAAIGGACLLAQEKSQTSPSLVPVETIITVEARHDHDKVPVLHREDVMAYERKERLRVTEVVPCQREDANLELFVLIDDGSSTSLGSQLDDLRRFIEGQPATVSVGIGYMRNGAVTVAQDLTAEHSLAAKALRLPLGSPGVIASPYLALQDLIDRWPAKTNCREIVFVTSGVDPLGEMGPTNSYLDFAIEHAQRQAVVVFPIYTPAAGHAGHSYWLAYWAQNYLSKLAEATGGEAHMLGYGPPVTFGPYLEDVSMHLANQYRVTVLMQAEKKGGLRKVRFSTEVPNAELVAPTEVYAPPPRENEQ